MNARDFQTSLLKSAARSSSTYAKQRQQELDDEEEKRALREAQAAVEQTQAQEAQASKPLAIASNVAGGVGNFIKDAAVDLYKTTESSVKGISDVIGGQAAADNLTHTTQQRDQLGKEHNERLSQLVDVNNQNDARWDSKEVQDENQKFQESLDSLTATDKGLKGSIETSQKVDATKVAADTAETFLNVATLGTGAAVKGVAKQAGKEILKRQGAKAVAKSAVKGAGEGAAFGAGAGYTDAISEGMAPEDAVNNIAQGALVGGVLGGASSGVGRGLKNRKDNKLIDEGNAQVEAQQTADAEAATVQEAQAALDAERPLNALPDEEIDARLEAFDAGEGRTGDVQADYQLRQQLLNEKQARGVDAERDSFLNNGLANDVEGAQTALDEFDNGTNRPDSVYTDAAPVDRAAAILARDDMPVELKNAAEEVVSDRNVVNSQLDGLMHPERRDAEIQRMDFEYDEALAALTQRFTRVNDSARTGGGMSVPTSDPSVPGQSVPGQNPIADYSRDPRFIAEKQRLDDNYQEQMAELDMLEAQDAPQVQELQGILNTLDRRDVQITNDANSLMEAAPGQFRDIDGPELQAQRQVIADNLEQAKRFNEPARVVSEMADSPDPVATFERSPEVQQAARTEAVTDAVSSPDISEMFKSKDTALSVLRALSPSQIFQKRGVRDLHSNVIKALSATNKANQDGAKVITEIAKALPESRAAQTQIIDYIEGKRLTLTGFDKKAADSIKGLLDGIRSDLNDMGYKTLDDYFPHLFDKKDPQVQRLFKGKTTGEINFGNLKERISDSEDYSKDIVDVLSQYVSGFNRKKYMEPALKPIADLKTQVEMTNNEAQFFDDYVNQLMGRGDKTMPGLAKVLGTQRMISAVATMGLNPGTAVRNMTQMVNTVADIGPRYAGVGAIDGARMLATKEGREELARVGIMDGGVSQNYYDAMVKPGVVGRAKKGADAAVKGMMIMIRATDVSLRAQAYAGAKALGRSKGIEGEALENFAIAKTVDSQFITSAADMPIAFNGQAVRSLTQLATFSGKQAGFLTRMGVKLVKGSDGKFRMRDAGAVLSGIALAAGATEMLKPIIGMRESEWIPFYDQVSGLWGEGGDPVYRSPAARLMFGDGKGKSGLVDILKGEDKGAALEEFMNDNWSQIVPAGTQIKKTTEGLATTTSGTSRNNKGNIRYLQDMDVDSQVKASLFGQYATEAGRNWIADGFPTLTEKQTDKVDSQPSRELKQLYTDFYQAKKGIQYQVQTEDGKKKGRDAAYAEVKKAAESGDVNRATRIASEYNAAVNKALAKFWQEHGTTVPKEIEDDITGGMYITASKLLED